eukprot:TRINITY_DN5214_c0_g1_i3.p1 TRINITY_DN5214_c0_g1~~TRINITY_DN5214_c0_g1_i3.p1  ORF type:complete len:394 (+),score=65.69 TRINITY_DN5214_c0_g1_i3:97-1182(+)
MAPKAKGKEIPPPKGLPPGWKCIEKVYLSGTKAGQTYVRFDSADGKHKTVLTVPRCIRIHAEENGLDPDEELAKYEAAKEEKKANAAAEREKAGIVKGQKREEAIDHFRSVHGPLDGATVMALPGWRGEGKLLENCGQVTAVYYDTDNRPWKLLKDIEAMFGTKMLAGATDLPDFDKARAEKDLDNMARKNVVDKFEYSDTPKFARAKKRKTFSVIDDADYKPCTKLAVSKIDIDSSKKEKSSDEFQTIDLLEKRAFSVIELVNIGTEAQANDKLISNFAGIYYKMADNLHQKPCFQRVGITKQGGLVCPGQYLFWSPHRKGWKIGALDDSKAGLALCCEDVECPTLTTNWLIWEPSYYEC